MTTKLEKEYEVLRNDFNTRSTLARDAFMQTKISHALDTNKKGCVARVAKPWFATSTTRGAARH